MMRSIAIVLAASSVAGFGVPTTTNLMSDPRATTYGGGGGLYLCTDNSGAAGKALDLAWISETQCKNDCNAMTNCRSYTHSGGWCYRYSSPSGKCVKQTPSTQNQVVVIPCSVPLCLNSCPGGYSDGGYARDGNGCQTCECRDQVFAIPCAVPLCLNTCPGGFNDGGYARDGNGCQTCECRIQTVNSGNSCGPCGDSCIEGGDMMGMCNSAGVCSFDYDNLGCSNSGSNGNNGNNGNNGQFVPISTWAACETNNQGITRTSGATGFTLQSCKQLCQADFRCQAIDFYRDSGWCNTYDNACSNPTTTREGSSSYRKAGSNQMNSAPFVVGVKGNKFCNKGQPITSSNDCREALRWLSIPEYEVNNGPVCYMDSQGNGYANNQNGNGASFICLNI